MSNIIIKYSFAVIIIFISITRPVNAQTPRPVPSAYSNPTINYVRTWDATSPQTDPNAMLTKPLRDVKQTTLYTDGLGRPIQTVLKQGSLITSGTAVDMVSAVEYDELGRVQFSYLPFASTATNGAQNNGLFKMDPFQQQASFYLSTDINKNPIAGQSEDFFYGQTIIESSPLNRVQKSMAPGDSWTGSSRGVEMKYLFNTTTDAVRIWNVFNGTSGNFGTYSTPLIYTAGKLYKHITIDEHGKQLIEFTDKEGKVILKKVQIGTVTDVGTGIGHGNFLCTYYIYDDLGNLRCVITPRGVELLEEGSWSSTILTAILPEQCFRYEYDHRNRMIMKKVPSTGEVFYVYDKWNRVVMTQDKNMQTPGNINYQKWLVTKYDDQNRPVETGLLLNTTPVTSHWTAASASSNYPTTTSNYDIFSRTGYDVYTTLPLASNLNNSMDITHNGHTITLNASPDYAEAIPSSASTLTRGMITWTQTRVLETSTFLYSVNIYDNKGRLVQVKTTNLNGSDVITTQYSWSGQPLVYLHKQIITGTGAQTTVTISRMHYDELGRMAKTEKKLQHSAVSGNAMSAYKILAEYKYDALGQLKNKKLAPAYNSNAGLETLSYDYNIRGWMLGMNRNYLSYEGQSGTFKFGFELGYDKTTNKSNQVFTGIRQYNGNISGMVWKSDGDDVRRIYDFTYDNANRLLKGDFKQDNGGTTWNKTMMDYSIKMGDGSLATSAYNANGNIKAMTQFGWKLGVSNTTPIDNLTYNYMTNSNKLLNVKDANNVADTKLGDFRTSALHPVQNKIETTVDYSYDANGNLKKDLNKDIGTSSIEDIIYNHLNLPQSITVRKTGGLVKGIITYTYDAAGNKLKKEITETGQLTISIGYNNGFVYENNVLQFIGHEEGRIRFNTENNTLQYDFMLRDHLGNVRMVLTEEQKQDQYPAATMEGTYSTTAPEATSMINHEKKFYTVNNSCVVYSTSMPGWSSGKDYQNNNGNPPYNVNYPSGTTPAAATMSGKVYRLNAATTSKTGLGIVLKVMAGDKIDIHGKSYYQSTTIYENSNSTVLMLGDIIGAFIGAPDNAGFGNKGISSGTMQNINTGLIPSTFIRGNDGTSSFVPKAYINFIFFDEQFKYAGGNSSRAGSSGTVKNHWFTDPQLQNVTVPKNGYIYVYVSNESNADVFFDNLQVFHTRGPILEETHYYPFGLKMAAISSKAFDASPNAFQYQGEYSEFDDETGWNEFALRNYDAQVGRFTGIDPYDQFASGYIGMGNDPVNSIDPDGGWSAGIKGMVAGAALSGLTAYLIARNNNKSIATSIGYGLGGALLGGGIGYGFEVSLFHYRKNDDGGFLLQTRAFYEGLFGGGDGHTQNFNGKISGRYAYVPPIWDNFSLRLKLDNPFKWLDYEKNNWNFLDQQLWVSNNSNRDKNARALNREIDQTKWGKWEPNYFYTSNSLNTTFDDYAGTKIKISLNGNDIYDSKINVNGTGLDVFNSHGYYDVNSLSLNIIQKSTGVLGSSVMSPALNVKISRFRRMTEVRQRLYILGSKTPFTRKK